jgi:hypothetical protein
VGLYQGEVKEYSLIAYLFGNIGGIQGNPTERSLHPYEPLEAGALEDWH